MVTFWLSITITSFWFLFYFVPIDRSSFFSFHIFNLTVSPWAFKDFIRCIFIVCNFNRLTPTVATWGQHPVPDRIKPSFVIFWQRGTDAQDWVSECPDVKNYKWRLNPVWHRMLHCCPHVATVGVKGLTPESVAVVSIMHHNSFADVLFTKTSVLRLRASKLTANWVPDPGKLLNNSHLTECCSH